MSGIVTAPAAAGTRRRAAVVVAALLTAALAACTAEAGPATPSDGPDIETGAAGLAALSDLLDEEGVLPADAALRLLASTGHEIPGIEPLDLSHDEAAHVAEAAAVRLGHLQDELDPEVAAAVAEALAPGEDEVEVPPGSAREGTIPDLGGTVPTRAELRDIVAQVTAGLEERSGRTLRLPVRASIRPGYRWLGSAIEVDGHCRVVLQEEMFRGDADSVLSTVAHELWHCFQEDATSTAVFDRAPLWMVEGQAEWAGEAYVGGSASSEPSWTNWLWQPEQSLTRRSYDAIGLYATAAQSTADPWRTMPGMFGRGRHQAVRALFDSPHEDALRHVATAFVGMSELGARWALTGPGAPRKSDQTLLLVAPGDDQEVALDVGHYGALPVAVVASGGAVLTVAAHGGTVGALQFQEGGLIDLPPGSSVDLCVDAGGCVCPDGTAHPAAANQVLVPDGAAALGSLQPAEVRISAHLQDLDEACEAALAMCDDRAHDPERAAAPAGSEPAGIRFAAWRDDPAEMCALGSLEGEWRTTVSEVFAALGMADVGLDCRGPWALTFSPDGAWRQGFEATCGMGDVTGQGVARMTGRWTDGGDGTFTAHDLQGEGTLTLAGVTQPLPVVDGFRAAMSRPVAYAIDGDTLTLTFHVDTVGPTTLRYTRVS